MSAGFIAMLIFVLVGGAFVLKIEYPLYKAAEAAKYRGGI